jgi:hypothetical protein
MASLAVGCASGKEAREVARGTLEGIITYEEEVAKKIKAEQTYYSSSELHAKESLKESLHNSENNIITSNSKDFQAEISNRRVDLQEADLKNFMIDMLGDIRKVRAHFEESKRTFEITFKSLLALEMEKQSLGKVRKGLEQLQAKPSTMDQLKEWFEFAKKVKEEMEKTSTAKTSK